MRYDHMGCAGNPIVKTPNIDAIAKRGLLFENAYVVNPTCMPSRVTLFTGTPPHIHGVRENGMPIDPATPVLPEALRQAGYATYSSGKIHVNNFNAAEEFGLGLENPSEENIRRFPECTTLWNSGVVKALPTPYYGFEKAKLVNGHTQYVFGDYINWLEEQSPGARKSLLPNHALEPVTVPQTYKMSIPEELHYNRYIADTTIEYLEENSKKDQPFFIWCSFPDPHQPYAAPKPWCDMYRPEDMPLPVARREGELDELPEFYRHFAENKTARWDGGSAWHSDDEVKTMIAMTYGMISFMDQEIGRVMEKLAQCGELENTVIVFLADHGDMMGDHWLSRKGTFSFDGICKIPYIYSWPKKFTQGEKNRGITGQIDFVPTILGLCGATMDVTMPGQSLAPVLEGNADKVHDWTIIENEVNNPNYRARTMVTERYKITVYAGRQYGELFDLRSDPNELYNLWNINKELKRELLAQFMDAYLVWDSPITI